MKVLLAGWKELSREQRQGLTEAGPWRVSILYLFRSISSPRRRKERHSLDGTRDLGLALVIHSGTRRRRQQHMQRRRGTSRGTL